MKLIHDCVRDVMLYLEDNLELDDCIMSSQINLPKYSHEDIEYTVIKLTEAGFINAEHRDLAGIIPIMSITYSGHQFLDSIRDNKIWSATKDKISQFASISLPMLQEVATTLIKSKLGI